MNQEQVVELLNVCIRNGKTAEAPGILMIRIGEELAAVCAGYYQHAELPTESVLNRYENMRPDDAQLRRALDRLLAVPSASGSKRLFHSPRHWLCVYKVFQFLQLMDDTYDCLSRMERRIASLYQGGMSCSSKTGHRQTPHKNERRNNILTLEYIQRIGIQHGLFL